MADAIVGVRPQQLAAEIGAALDRGGEPAEEDASGTDTVTKTAKKTTAKKTTAKKTTAKNATDGARPRTPAKKTASATGTGPVHTGAAPAAPKSETAAPAPGRRTTGATADSVLAVLAGAQGPLRAREVTARPGWGSRSRRTT
ncbi:hypothetical protein [Kitasatospora aureofaciens]|uniref:hypothetical protein n=1 Tax=Kitasatospora aureofaciens TaxID=1894 RepID=UPI0036F491D9